MNHELLLLPNFSTWTLEKEKGEGEEKERKRYGGIDNKKLLESLPPKYHHHLFLFCEKTKNKLTYYLIDSTNSVIITHTHTHGAAAS